MSETKFTPGPWWPNWSAPRPFAFAVDRTFTSDKGTVIAHVALCPFMSDLEEFTSEEGQAEYNAALIAAAPWLYSALESLLKTVVDDLGECGYGEDDIADHEGVKNAKAALAKARGES